MKGVTTANQRSLMSSLKRMDKMKLKEDQELVQHLVHTGAEQTLEPNFLISSLLSFCSVKDKGRVGWMVQPLLWLEGSQIRPVTGEWHGRYW